MKYLVIVAMLCLTACASTNVEKTSNSINYSTGYTRVLGTGQTFDEAKTNAFNTAIEIVVGSVILSDKQSNNNQLVRDEIVKASAGYVDDYTIISESKTGRGYTLVMDVKVKNSKIAERVLSAGKSETNLKGEALNAQYQTYQQDRVSGDALLSSVLSSYPKHAFNVSNVKIDCGNQTAHWCFKLDRQGNALIEVPYKLNWNYNFLRAFNEALSITTDSKSYGADVITVMSKDPKALLLGSTDKYYFTDVNRFKMIQSTFVGDIHVVANVMDNTGTVLYTSCSNPVYQKRYSERQFMLHGNDKWEGRVMVKIDKNSNYDAILKKATKVELSYSSTDC